MYNLFKLSGPFMIAVQVATTRNYMLLRVLICHAHSCSEGLEQRAF